MAFSINENMSKQRQHAEIAFAKTQIALPPMNRARQELENLVTERDANTIRLRELRVARELFDKTQ